VGILSDFKYQWFIAGFGLLGSHQLFYLFGQKESSQNVNIKLECIIGLVYTWSLHVFILMG